MSGQLWIHEWLTLRHGCLIYELFISLHTPQHKQLYLVICWSYQGCLMLVLLPPITLVLWNLNRIYNQIWILHTWFILQGSLTLQQLEGFACNFQRIFCWQIWQGGPSAAWEPLVRAGSVLTQHGWVFLAQDKRGEWVLGLGQSSSTSSMPPAHAQGHAEAWWGQTLQGSHASLQDLPSEPIPPWLAPGNLFMWATAFLITEQGLY